MNLLHLAWKNISRNRLRSAIVAVCALVVAAFSVFATLLLRGTAASLELTVDRLGADIVVVPQEAQTEMEGALLMSIPVNSWMPADTAEKLRSIPGVEAVSPQLYLATLVDTPFNSAPETFLIAFDPETDFTVQPWLSNPLATRLGPGDVIGGSNISATEGKDGIRIYGDLVTLKGNLEPTGTGLDQSLFFTLDTAHDMAQDSEGGAGERLVVPVGQISAVLLQTRPLSSTEEIAVEIYRTVPGVYPIQSANVFHASRIQLKGLLDTVTMVLAVIWPLAVLLTGLIYLLAANERRRELGVLRALGATSRFISLSLLIEASLLALCGAAVGALLAASSIYLFRSLIMTSLGVPFLLPSPASLALQVGIGLLLAMFSVVLAALLPAIQISRQEPAVAMRK
ncbi:MAG TPA: ABC transporter permease [Anaerolineae bacterium]|nr:ABC transporter permease [Anaerolineae bacterium]